MEISFQLTADDFRRGMIAWRSRSRWRRRGYRLGLALMVPILVLSVALLVSYPHSEVRQNLWIMFGASAFWLAFVKIMPWFSARMQFRGMPLAQSPMTVAVSETGLHTRSAHGDSQIAWPAYMGWSEEKSVFVLFPQPRIYIPIPKRAFTEHQQMEFRDILRRNVVPIGQRERTANQPV